MLWDMDKDFQKLMEQVYGPLNKDKMTELKFTSPNGENTIKVEGTGRLGTVTPKTQLHIKMNEPVKYETPMTKNEEEIEKVKAQIKVLEKKLSFLEELEKTKSPVEESYKRVYGYFPTEPNWDDDEVRWESFQKGYKSAQKDYKVGEFQEPAKDVVSLYKRFVNEGAYGMTSFENALRVVKDFLMDEGVIEYEDDERITFTLQKYLLDTPNA
jgi:hypothetical protein